VLRGRGQHPFSEILSRFFLEERNSRAAKAGPDQSRSQASGEGSSDIMKKIELRAGDFIVVPQASVGSEQEISQETEVVSPKRLYGLANAPVLGNDVSGSLEGRIAHCRTGLFKLL
jgi:hypothetical protein